MSAFTKLQKHLAHIERRHNAATKTLESLGYTYHAATFSDIKGKWEDDKSAATKVITQLTEERSQLTNRLEELKKTLNAVSDERIYLALTNDRLHNRIVDLAKKIGWVRGKGSPADPLDYIIEYVGSVFPFFGKPVKGEKKSDETADNRTKPNPPLSADSMNDVVANISDAIEKMRKAKPEVDTRLPHEQLAHLGNLKIPGLHLSAIPVGDDEYGPGLMPALPNRNEWVETKWGVYQVKGMVSSHSDGAARCISIKLRSAMGEQRKFPGKWFAKNWMIAKRQVWAGIDPASGADISTFWILYPPKPVKPNASLKAVYVSPSLMGPVAKDNMPWVHMDAKVKTNFGTYVVAGYTTNGMRYDSITLADPVTKEEREFPAAWVNAICKPDEEQPKPEAKAVNLEPPAPAKPSRQYILQVCRKNEAGNIERVYQRYDQRGTADWHFGHYMSVSSTEDLNLFEAVGGVKRLIGWWIKGK